MRFIKEFNKNNLPILRITDLLSNNEDTLIDKLTDELMDIMYPSLHSYKVYEYCSDDVEKNISKLLEQYNITKK